MKKGMTLIFSAFLLAASAFGIAACGDKKTDTVSDDIVNGGFEQGVGDLTGWTKTGSAFSQYGVVNTDKVGNVVVGKVGNNFFSGYEAGNPQFTGTLTSDTFKLGGTGKIGFLLGAGKNGDKCYVEFYEEGNDTPLLKITNTAFNAPYVTDHLIRNIADLSEYVGKNIYIKVTDNDKGDAEEYSYVNLDDFKVYQTEAEVEAAQKERDDKLAEIGAPEFSEDPTETTIKNGDFEDGMNNWLVLEGNTFGPSVIGDASELFWNTRSFNAEGEKFLNGYKDDESFTGAVRSTKFTLAGDGIISLLLGGSGQDDIYVAVCDGETDEELFVVSPAEHFKDPELSENMLRKYIDARAYIGKVLYIKIVDGAASPFGAITVDSVRVSMTEEETVALMQQDYAWAQGLPAEDVSASATQKYYNDYDYPYELPVLRFATAAANRAVKASETPADLTQFLADVVPAYGGIPAEEIAVSIVKVAFGEQEFTSGFDAFDLSEAGVYTVTYQAVYESLSLSATFTVEVTDEYSIMNGGFETGSLAGWTYEQGTGNGQIAGDAAVSSATEWWVQRMPYNKVGTYHFDGWAANATESNTYWLRSSVFTLGGSGWISFKMGGNAAVVKVFKEDGTRIGEFVNTAFADVAFPNIDEGCRLATMTTFAANLSDYSGERLYIELHDVSASGWAVAFFDDIITYYETAPDVASLSDTVQFYKKVDGVQQEEPTSYNIPWVIAANTADQLIIVDPAQNVTTETKTVDLNTYLSGVSATILGQTVSGVLVDIVKVSDGEQDVTEGFDSFLLETGKTYIVSYKVSDPASGKFAEATFSIVVTSSYQIINGDFETGDLTGWTIVEGEGVSVSNAKVFWERDANFFDMNGETVQYYMQEGNYFLVTDEAKTVVIKSSDFVVEGDGIIAFKFGIAKNAVSYVALCDAQTDEELIKVDNTAYFNDPLTAQALLRRFMDAGDYVGREVYVKVVDGATSDFGFLNFDDLRVNLSETEAQELIDAEKEWASSYRQDVLDSSEEMGSRTKEIIQAIRNYYVQLALPASEESAN